MALDLSPEALAFLEFAAGRREKTRKGLERLRDVPRKPRNPIAVEKAYERFLLALARKVSNEIRRSLRKGLAEARRRERQDADLIGIFDEEEFLALRLRLSKIIRQSTTPAVLDRFGNRLNDANATETQRVIGVNPAGISLEITGALATFRGANVDLITTIVDGQLDQVRNLITEASSSGMRVETLARRIEERFSVAESRARLIARDQILKANSNLTQIRQRAVGATAYRWSTSNDDRVRDDHAILEGTIQSWDNPPVTNPQGDTNNPGEDYQCRCVAIPILPA